MTSLSLSFSIGSCKIFCKVFRKGCSCEDNHKLDFLQTQPLSFAWVSCLKHNSHWRHNTGTCYSHSLFPPHVRELRKPQPVNTMCELSARYQVYGNVSLQIADIVLRLPATSPGHHDTFQPRLSSSATADYRGFFCVVRLHNHLYLYSQTN